MQSFGNNVNSSLQCTLVVHISNKTVAKWLTCLQKLPSGLDSQVKEVFLAWELFPKAKEVSNSAVTCEEFLPGKLLKHIAHHPNNCWSLNCLHQLKVCPYMFIKAFEKRKSLTRGLIVKLLIWTSVSSSLLFSSQLREELDLSYSCFFSVDRAGWSWYRACNDTYYWTVISNFF